MRVVRALGVVDRCDEGGRGTIFPTRDLAAEVKAFDLGIGEQGFRQLDRASISQTV